MITMPRCKVSGCDVKYAVYGFHDGKKECCAAHKENGMIDLKCVRCDIDGCDIRPSYGYVGQKATRCKMHIESGMVNVKCKKCSFDGCQKQPAYGYTRFNSK